MFTFFILFQASSMEGDYHNPYDHHQRFAGLEALAASAAAASATSNNTSEADGGNVYEAPSCLVRNPSGSLFIPSGGKDTFVKLQYVCI